MKKSTAVLFALALAGVAHSQTLTIQGSTPFVIKTNTIVSAAGLVLQPSSDLPLAAPLTLTRINNISHSSSNTSILRSYIFSNTVPGFTGNVSIFYQDAELNGLAESLLSLNIHDGASWNHFETGVTRDAAGNYVATTGLAANLNELTLASELMPLPLTWGPVKAARKTQSVSVEWSTNGESQVSHFTVERSTDGVHWTEAGVILYVENNGGIHHYSLEDFNAPPVKLFYRVKETDKDGRTSISPIASVAALEQPIEIILYPNPATSTIKLYAGGGSKIKTVQVYDINGKLMRVNAECNDERCTMSVSQLPAGTYNINLLMQNGAVYNRAFIKQ